MCDKSNDKDSTMSVAQTFKTCNMVLAMIYLFFVTMVNLFKSFVIKNFVTKFIKISCCREKEFRKKL